MTPEQQRRLEILRANQAVMMRRAADPSYGTAKDRRAAFLEAVQIKHEIEGIR